MNFNKIQKSIQKTIDKESKARLERCIPVAQEIMRMIASDSPPIGDIADKRGEILKDVSDKYDELAAKILTLMLKNNLNYFDKEFIFQLVMQMVEKTKDKVIKSMERSFDRASEKKWGKDMMDLTMEDIHNILLGK